MATIDSLPRIHHVQGTNPLEKFAAIAAGMTGSRHVEEVNAHDDTVTIAGIVGAQHVQGTDSYTTAKYQYATSTYGEERKMNPALIIQPRNKSDIVLALKYAKAKGVSVAIRTGGHQYSGASSTAAPNIQLDLGETFQGPEDRSIFEKGGRTYVRTSVSWPLGRFNQYLTDHHLFIPHGQCTEVHLGGHVQTGGYGQLGRSFGLFGDHVISLELIDHEGEFKEVTKSNDPELFWALLGGSPGNLGVITHFTLRVHRDRDYEGSMGMKALYWYDPQTLERLVNILVEMSDDPDFPRNYDFCISVLSSSFKLLELWPGLDEQMREDNPEVYGENDLLAWPSTIIVYAQYVPFDESDRPDMAWFDRIREGSVFTPGPEMLPMSQLTGKWIFRNRREFLHPYVKRTYLTDSTTLGQDGWASWVTKRIDSIVTPEKNRCWLSAQLQSFGGRYSKFRTNADNGTAYSWRKDTTLCATLDCFHTSKTKSRALDWQNTNDEEGIGPSGVFCQEDRRVLWGSYGSFDLDANWARYYEDIEKYERLQTIRKRVDPHGIFTPNTFAVKASD